MADRKLSTGKDYIYFIWENLHAIRTADKASAEKKGNAEEGLQSLWVLMGFSKPCRFGELPSKG